MRLFSWNVNGLRSVYRKNFLTWLKENNPDFVCLQEIKANRDQLPAELSEAQGYHSFFNSAVKKGYSGTAVYSKEKPLAVRTELGFERFDSEGRYLELTFKNWILINLYLPHGGRQKENLAYKLECYHCLLKRLEEIKDKQVIVLGDFNIAHSGIDLARPKDNRYNIMFTQEEREQIDRILSLGYLDTFRIFNNESGHYTWWPYHSNARERNLGWRIDYIFASRQVKEKIASAFIQCETLGSDHCPVSLEIKLE